MLWGWTQFAAAVVVGVAVAAVVGQFEWRWRWLFLRHEDECATREREENQKTCFNFKSLKMIKKKKWINDLIFRTNDILVIKTTYFLIDKDWILFDISYFKLRPIPKWRFLYSFPHYTPIILSTVPYKIDKGSSMVKDVLQFLIPSPLCHAFLVRKLQYCVTKSLTPSSP